MSNKNLNLFCSLKELRYMPEQIIINRYIAARREDKELADKIILFCRDYINGVGERRVARIMFRQLCILDPAKARRNLLTFLGYGRFDDLYEFLKTPIENDIWELISSYYTNDKINMMRGQPISLLAKWLKSPNTSNKYSCYLGKLTAKKLGLTNKQYRKDLKRFRAYLKIPEHYMCRKDFHKIEYKKIGSKALYQYRKSFLEHDKKRYVNFIKEKNKHQNKQFQKDYVMTLSEMEFILESYIYL